jgi:hypothetical protein
MGTHETAGSSDRPHPSFNSVTEAAPGQGSELKDSQAQSVDELREEQRKIRRLQLMMDMVMSVIGQDASLTVDEAAEMVADSRRAALAMFPDKELAYNLIYKPRLQRLMRERYRIQ